MFLQTQNRQSSRALVGPGVKLYFSEISIGETTNFRGTLVTRKNLTHEIIYKINSNPKKNFFSSNETHTLFKTRSFVTAEFHLSLAQKLVGALIPLKS